MPIIDGIKAAAQLKESGSKTKILVLTVQDDEDFVRASFSNGASGYVIKSRIAADLMVALKEVLEGRRFLSFSSKFDRSSILDEVPTSPLDGSPVE